MGRTSSSHGTQSGQGAPELVERFRSETAAELQHQDWRGVAGEIAQTGEEDPLAMVDDPDLAAVIAAKMRLRRSAEARENVSVVESDFAHALEVAKTFEGDADDAAILDLERLAKAGLALLQAREFDQADNTLRTRQLSMLAVAHTILDRYLAE